MFHDSSKLTALNPHRQRRKRSYSTEQKIGKIPVHVLKRLPKAELHCHLDGAVRLETIIDLAQEQAVLLPSYDPEELAKHVVVDENCDSLVKYLRGFDITLLVLQKAYAITRAVYEICEDAVADGIRYLEIRFSPILHTREGLTLSAIMEAAREGQTMAEYKFSIIVNIIVCGMRHMDPEVTKTLAEIAWRYKHKGVVGFDLAGPEDGFSSKQHEEAFRVVTHKLLNVTLHSGEACGWESVQDSIQYCGAKRLGHGTRMRENQELVQYVVDTGLAVEICLTSNLHTKAVARLLDHPVREYLEQGVKIVICTDNPTVSGITLTNEYQLLQDVFNFSLEEIIRVIDYGFCAAFIEETRKNRLRAEVLKDCISILREEGYDVTSIVKNSDYFDWIGVNIPELINFEPGPYWKRHTNPPVTLELCQKIPKADLHCTFDGGVSVEFVFDELQRLRECGNNAVWSEVERILDEPFADKGDFVRIVRAVQQSSRNEEILKRVSPLVLQSRGQLERALENIYANAIAQTIRYTELSLRPLLFTTNGLGEADVIECILAKRKELNDRYAPETYFAVILYVSTTLDNPAIALRTAHLAINNLKEGVVGFALYGSKEIAIELYAQTFDLLKAKNVKTAIFVESYDGIIGALSVGGAKRLSGAFSLHKYPSIMSHLANHKILVELANTASFKHLAQEMVSISNPITLLLDNSVPLNLCQYRAFTSPLSLSEGLFSVAEHLPIDCLFLLLSHGFRYNFSPMKQRKTISLQAKHAMEALLNSLNYRHYYKEHYLPF